MTMLTDATEHFRRLVGWLIAAVLLLCPLMAQGAGKEDAQWVCLVEAQTP